MDLSKSKEKVIPHQRLKIEEDRVKQEKPVKEDEYSPGQPIRLREVGENLRGRRKDCGSSKN